MSKENTKPKPIRSWYGYVTACRDTVLVGGTSHHRSVRFETREQASAWIVSCLEVNSSANRSISAWGTVGSEKEPEIYVF